MYTVLLDRISRPIIGKLNKVGIVARPIWVPTYKLPAFKGNCLEYQCDFAEKFYQRALSLPCSVGLGEKQSDRVIRTLIELLEEEL